MDRKHLNVLTETLKHKDKFHIFRDMQNYDITSTISNVEIKVFPKGHTIIEEGEITETVYLIIKGECNAVSSHGCILGQLARQDIFGEIAGMMHRPRECSIVAKSKVITLSFVINHHHFSKYMSSFAYLYRNICILLSYKLLPKYKFLSHLYYHDTDGDIIDT